MPPAAPAANRWFGGHRQTPVLAAGGRGARPLAGEPVRPHIAGPMRTACPACNTAYEVPDRLIGAAGRELRCARCGHAWLVRPPDAAPGPPVAPPPPPVPPVSRPSQAPSRAMPPPLATPQRSPQVIDPPLPQQDDGAPRPTAALRAAWAASVLLVVLAIAALWVFRAAIVAAWPPMARLYLALGIGTDGG